MLSFEVSSDGSSVSFSDILFSICSDALVVCYSGTDSLHAAKVPTEHINSVINSNFFIIFRLSSPMPMHPVR